MLLSTRPAKIFMHANGPSNLMKRCLAHRFDTLNEKKNDVIEEIRQTTCDLITFSHLVPRCITFYSSKNYALRIGCFRFIGSRKNWKSFCLSCFWPHTAVGMEFWMVSGINIKYNGD